MISDNKTPESDNQRNETRYVVTDEQGRVLTKPMSKHMAIDWARSPLTTGLYGLRVEVRPQ